MYWPAQRGTRRIRLNPLRRWRQWGRPALKFLGALGLLLIAAACAGRGDGRPPGDTVTLKPDAARIGFDLPEFGSAEGQHSRYRSTDRRYREDFAEWRLADDILAGLTLSTATKGKPLSDPVQLVEILRIWPVFNDKHPTFGNPATARNGLGAIDYRRVAVATRTCVLFRQRWTAPDLRIATAGSATLSGFYCNPPGTLLTPDAALTVLRAVVLRPPRVPS